MEMPEEWKRAGSIAAQAREFSRKLVKPGMKTAEIAEMVEKKIIELGGVPAFPVNVSMNEFAAHCTPETREKRVLADEVVKIDIGTCVNGAIGDTAYTVDLSGRHSELVKAAEEALLAAEKVLGVGTTLGSVGKAIQETIESYGYRPIHNLSGHGLGLYSVHDSPSIPNVDTGDNTLLQEGQTIAIEPFATDGAGEIKESGRAEIYSQVAARQVRNPITRQILEHIKKYRQLPFAKRWLEGKFGSGRTALGLRELENCGCIKAYPPLKEIRNGIVAQAEHSYVIGPKTQNTTRNGQ